MREAKEFFLNVTTYAATASSLAKNAANNGLPFLAFATTGVPDSTKGHVAVFEVCQTTLTKGKRTLKEF